MSPRRHLPLILLSLVAAGLAGCGPQMLSPDRAYEVCSERARQAAGPTGRIGIGVGSDGPIGNLEVTVTDDYLRGRDPNLVYDTCFRQRTGAGPTRPLIL